MPEQKDMGHFEHSKRAQLGISSVVERPFKVVYLGAGSGFLERLFVDILNIPGADSGELALVDVDPRRLELGEKICNLAAKQLSKDWRITASTDRRGVLDGADYIINCIEVSGIDCVRFDNDIPKKYGVDQCIGDTLGPGGLFKALRTVPVFLEVLADVERQCPGAWMLNYTNPMSIMCLSAARASKAKVVGLCHSVQGSSNTLAKWTNVPYHRMKWQCAGINHLAWFTELSCDGRDLYPVLRDRVLNEPGFVENDPVKFDLMLHFGYYPTETSGHNSEYLPYYRKRPDLLKKFMRGGYLGESSYYANNWPAWRKGTDQRRSDVLSGKAQLITERSWEYASFIIQAMETNQPVIIHGNVPNRGLIENLPRDGVVEVACVVGRAGVRPTHFGRLPSGVAALCDSNMRMIDLAADACIGKDRNLAAQALMLDPLTSAVCGTSEIKRMTEELFEAEKDFLPGF